MAFPDPSPRLGDTNNVLLFKIAQILDEGCSGGGGGGGVTSFNGATGAVTGVASFNTRTGAVTLTLGDVSAVADARYVLKTGDTMTGALNINMGTVIVDTPGLYITETVNDDGTLVFAGFRMDLANTTEDEDVAFMRFRFNSGGSGLFDTFRVGANGAITSNGSSALGPISIFTTNSFSGTGLKLVVNSTGIGFFGTAAQVKQTLGGMVNGVTAGGTDDSIANFTSLSVYATDAATIRNDIYQLARKLNQVVTGLRNYGLFT